MDASNPCPTLLRPRDQLRSIVTNMPVCVSLSARISPEPHAGPLPNFLCMLPMSVARSSSGLLTIGRIAYRREGVDGSAQRERSVIYDCLVLVASKSVCCRLLSAVIERVVEENRVPCTFGLAAITLGIGPHSSLLI